MTDDQPLRLLLRSALPPVTDLGLAKDLWPSIVHRRPALSGWPWLDLGVAAAVALVLALFPDWLWLLAYHL
ncbi:MAG TPA: hypothetical protein VHR45_17150 [Thermoanaerobaculia bacterium]|nr:hypothetical protein [Thermoanaerobaculia bacterium]